MIVLCCWEVRAEFLPFVCKLRGQALKGKLVSGEGDLAGFCSALGGGKDQPQKEEIRSWLETSRC